jgi:metal-responsive CopG/Arc/MetJ family transcriptional regulator
VRTLVDLPEEDVAALDDLRERRSLSRAKIIREAVSDYLARHRGGAAEAAFGLWRDRKIDGVDFQRRLRAEW